MLFKSYSFAVLVGSAILVLSASSRVSAQNVFANDITGTGARNFSDTTVWSTGAVPGSGNQAIVAFGDGITDYVYVDVDTTVQRINIGNVNSGGLEIRSGATLTTIATGSSQSNIGPGGASPGVGHLRILPGATLNQSGLLYLGLNANGTGMVTLSDTATHTLAGALAIRDGLGTYDMLGGVLTVGGFFQVARNGNGTFTQSGGALQVNNSLVTQEGMFIGLGASGASGLYEISDGSLTVAASNLGVVNGSAAGAGVGTFRIVGDAPTISIGTQYRQNHEGRLELVVDSGGISPMNVGTNVFLDGTLDVSFTATPTFGQQFTIMNYTGNLSGTFSSFDNLVDGPGGADSIFLGINYGAGTNSSIVLTVLEQLGDFNMMNGVNEDDFFILSDNLGAHLDRAVAYADGDINNDGKIDLVDFNEFKDLYPLVFASAMGVPEPSTWMLALLAGVWGSFALRRQHRR